MTDPKWDVQRAVLGTKIPPAAKLIMMVMLDKTNGPLALERFSPSLAGLMDQTGYSRQTVVTYLDLLGRHGWLTASRKRGRTTWYTVAEGKPFARPAPAGLADGPAGTGNWSIQETTTGLADRPHPSSQQTGTGLADRPHTHHSPETHGDHRAPASAGAAHHGELRSVHQAGGGGRATGITMDGPAPWDYEVSPDGAAPPDPRCPDCRRLGRECEMCRGCREALARVGEAPPNPGCPDCRREGSQCHWCASLGEAFEERDREGEGQDDRGGEDFSFDDLLGAV